MNNLDRLKMEIKSIQMNDVELTIYLNEAGLNANDEYSPTDKQNTIKIYDAALSILESVANDTNMMKTYKMDDISVSNFHEQLMKRIDQLSDKITKIKREENKKNESNYFVLWSN